MFEADAERRPGFSSPKNLVRFGIPSLWAWCAPCCSGPALRAKGQIVIDVLGDVLTVLVPGLLEWYFCRGGFRCTCSMATAVLPAPRRGGLGARGPHECRRRRLALVAATGTRPDDVEVPESRCMLGRTGSTLSGVLVGCRSPLVSSHLPTPCRPPPNRPPCTPRRAPPPPSAPPPPPPRPPHPAPCCADGIIPCGLLRRRVIEGHGRRIRPTAVPHKHHSSRRTSRLSVRRPVRGPWAVPLWPSM